MALRLGEYDIVTRVVRVGRNRYSQVLRASRKRVVDDQPAERVSPLSDPIGWRLPIKPPSLAAHGGGIRAVRTPPIVRRAPGACVDAQTSALAVRPCRCWQSIATQGRRQGWSSTRRFHASSLTAGESRYRGCLADGRSLFTTTTLTSGLPSLEARSRFSPSRTSRFRSRLVDPCTFR